MDNRLDRIEDKLDKVSDRIGSIDITLAAQHESLKTHIRRTELLEQRIEPVEKHVVMLNGIAKFVGFTGIIVGIAVGITELISFLIERSL